MNSSERLSAGLKALPDKISSFASTQAAWRFYRNESVSLSNPRFVKGFVVGNKNDFNEELDEAIKDQDRRINRLCNANELSKRFLEVPGVGPITATIVAADIDNGKGYASSQDYAASKYGAIALAYCANNSHFSQ